MIVHGKTQISEMVYARLASEGGGAVRLTNIIRGPQVVFGGLHYGRLSPATKALILAAFGQTDGKAVIAATLRYLNVLAASDPTKAQAMAGFINQHPLDAALYGGLYVQDGLVFQMDRAYECTAAKWTDFIGGVEFNGTNVQIVDDVPYFNGGHYYSNDSSRHSYNTCTIEVTFTPASNISGYTFLYTESNADRIAMTFGRQGLMCNAISADNCFGLSAYANTLYSVSAANTQAYANKAALNKIRWGDSWSSRTGKWIGVRDGSAARFYGKIYGIRIYNRLLTEAEILANQDIDLKRFTP